MSKTILFVSGHTHPETSLANKAILEQMKHYFPEAVFDMLLREYPDFDCDVEKEQAKLMAADIIVLQYPMFWFNAPSIVERWLEEVFLHGFAYGADGDKLAGKTLIISLTSGAPEEAYTQNDHGGVDIEAYLLPLKATAAYTGMKWGGFVYSGGMMSIGADDSVKKELLKKAENHARRLQSLIGENGYTE